MTATTLTPQSKNIKGDEKMKATKKATKKAPKRLKKLRVDAGYTIYSLADKLNVNFSSVSYWENGIKHPRHDKIMELEDLFKVNYREMFTDLTDEEAKELEQRK